MLATLAQMDAPQLSAKQMVQRMRATASAKMIVDAYATQVLEQPKLSLAELPDLATHQATAKTNAEAWSNTVSPLIIQANTDVLDFSNQFNSFYTTLLKLAHAIDKGDNQATFVKGLQLLTDGIEDKHKKATTAFGKLTDLQGSVTTDHANFAGDQSLAQTIYAGDTGEIARLQKLNDSLQTSMSNDLETIGFEATGFVVAGLTIACGLLLELPTAGASTAIVAAGILVGVGTTGAMITAGVQYGKALSKYKSNVAQIATDQAEVAALGAVGDQITSLMTATSQGVVALGSMVDTWRTLGTQFTGVIGQLQGVGPVKPDAGDDLAAELTAAKADWDDVTATAHRIEQQCSNVPVVNQPPPLDPTVEATARTLVEA